MNIMQNINTYMSNLSELYINYNVLLVISFIYTYVFLLFLLIPLNFNNNAIISQKFANYLHKLPTHSRFIMFFLFNFLLGTPPFLIFWYKLLFIYSLSLTSQLFLSLLLLLLNLIFSYVYLQSFFFLKKTKKTKKLSIPFNKYQTIFNWLVYINGLGIIFFPFFLSFWL